MNTPFGIVVTAGGERHIQVLVSFKCAVSTALDHLMEICLIRKRAQCLARRSIGMDLERGTEVQLADANVVVLETPKHVGRFLEFDRKVASVIIHAEVPIQAIVSGA